MRLEESGSHLVKPSRPHVGAVAGGPTRGQRSGGIWVSSVFNMPPRSPQNMWGSARFSYSRMGIKKKIEIVFSSSHLKCSIVIRQLMVDVMHMPKKEVAI